LFGAGGGVRDVTARYASDYHTRVKAQRVKDEWWNTALAKHAPKDMVCTSIPLIVEIHGARIWHAFP
jgi:hypothetical protein